MLGREQLEQQEERSLGSWALRSTQSAGRRHADHPDPHRPAFARDRDRIVHSGAFRRLEYKTQVLINGRGDNYRTRLTHSLEVAQISRACARVLQLNESLVEAVALAHDLGHPPFGHTGEDALLRVMARIEERTGDPCGGFEHNVQALRLVDLLECPYPGIRGLNLCLETRESILKHGQAKAGTLAEGLRDAPQPWLEAQLVDEADAMAYLSHDLEDGLRFGVLEVADLGQIELWARAHAAARARYPEASESELLRPTIHQTLTLPIHNLVEESARRLQESEIDSPMDARQHPRRLIGPTSEMAQMQVELKRFLFQRFYRAESVVQDRIQASRKLEELFEFLYEHPEHLDETGDAGPRVFRLDENAPLSRRVCDYVAGMTDRFAENLHSRLLGPA